MSEELSQANGGNGSWLDWVRRHFFAVTVGILAVLFFANQFSRQFFTYSSDAYVSTDTITLAPAVAGILDTIKVRDNESVAAGDLLFALDQVPFETAVSLAEANVKAARAEVKTANDTLIELKAAEASAKAALDDAQKTEARIKALTERGVTTQQRLDDLTRDVATLADALDQAKAAITVGEDNVTKAGAMLEAANADLSIARYNRSRSSVSATVDGTIAPFGAGEGDYVDVGTPVMTLVSDGNWHLIANVLEQHLAHTKVGDTVYFMMSSQPWRVFKGRVRSLARGISRSPVPGGTLPYVEPTTEWIRLSRRFPIEIDIGDLPQTLPFYLGSDVRVLIVHSRGSTPD